MTTTLSETVIENRRKGIAMLRTTTLPRGVGEFYDPATGCYCALGILALAAGIPLDGEVWFAVEKAYGIGYNDGRDSSCTIYRMNDGEGEGNGQSFSDIGEYLAGVWGVE